MRAIFTTLLVTIISFTALAQNKKEKHPTLISIRPIQLIYGTNVGIEVPLSSELSLKTVLNYHHFYGNSEETYYPSRNIAISPTLKWYFRESVGKGWHLNLKTFFGYFIEKHPFGKYYVGGGIGIGWIKPFEPKSRWHFFIETNLKIPYTFGHTANENDSDNHMNEAVGEAIYFILASPASILEFNLGIAFRL